MFTAEPLSHILLYVIMYINVFVMYERVIKHFSFPLHRFV